MPEEEITKTIITGDYSVIVALIGFIGSIIVAVISGFVSYIIARKTTENEIRKMRSDFVGKLYEKRMNFYPELWKIADKMYGARRQHKKAEEKIQRNEECLHELKAWKRNSGGFMFISEKSLKAFNKVVNALDHHPSNKNYPKEKLDKVENARIIFCKALKEDIGIFESAENKIKKEA